MGFDLSAAAMWAHLTVEHKSVWEIDRDYLAVYGTSELHLERGHAGSHPYTMTWLR